MQMQMQMHMRMATTTAEEQRRRQQRQPALTDGMPLAAGGAMCTQELQIRPIRSVSTRLRRA